MLTKVVTTKKPFQFTTESWRKLSPFTVSASLVVLLVVATAILTLHRRRVSSALFNTNASIGTSTTPPRGEAYELYLRSLAYKPEPPDNAKAITLLERSTTLDPGSPTTWYELSRRYHFEYLPGGRGQQFLQQAREANRRALQLAPGSSPAKLHHVMLDVEAGQLGPAYDVALAMTRANPQDANSHFALSYVLRFGGMFKESAEECELAVKIDPSNVMFRSCSITFIQLGRYDRAPAFVDLDPLSVYARFRKIEMALRRTRTPGHLNWRVRSISTRQTITRRLACSKQF